MAPLNIMSYCGYPSEVSKGPATAYFLFWTATLNLLKRGHFQCSRRLKRIKF